MLTKKALFKMAKECDFLYVVGNKELVIHQYDVSKLNEEAGTIDEIFDIPGESGLRVFKTASLAKLFLIEKHEKEIDRLLTQNYQNNERVSELTFTIVQLSKEVSKQIKKSKDLK